MADLKITQLDPLSGASLAATDPLAIADVSASETKKITAKDLVQAAVGLIDDASIPAAKVVSSPVVIPDGSITASKLADDSSGIVAGAAPTASFRGQIWLDNTNGKSYIWDGAAWVAHKAAGSINTLTGDVTGVARLQVTQTGDSVALDAYLADTTAAGQVLAGSSTGTGSPSYRRLVSADLPVANATDAGVVVVNGSGLAMTGGTIGIDNAVAASTNFHVVTYTANGLVTGGRALSSADLPLATNTTAGAIIAAGQFAADASGHLAHSNSIIAGTATKVTFDNAGHIVSTSSLDATDVPDLPASKITTGSFSSDRIGAGSITALKLADYSTSYIQDTQPSGTSHFHGQLWLNPLAQQIRMWDGNVWVPIGVGALAEQNLRFCGLFDATNGQITVLTTFGSEAGFHVGDVIPTATEQLTGSYFVSQTTGNGTGVTPGVTYDPGDWCVCLGVAQGWQRIDTLNGGSGGGSLDSLADVEITTPGAGQTLTYNGTFWVNQTIPSASDTVKGIIQLATDAEVKTGTDALKTITPKTLADNYLAKNIATLPALP